MLIQLQLQMQRCCKYSYRCRDVLNTLAVAVAVAVAARRCICICAPGNTRLYLHIQTSIPTAQATILHSNQYCYSFHIVRTICSTGGAYCLNNMLHCSYSVAETVAELPATRPAAAGRSRVSISLACWSAYVCRHRVLSKYLWFAR
jgi:hypothetical protein